MTGELGWPLLGWLCLGAVAGGFLNACIGGLLRPASLAWTGRRRLAVQAAMAALGVLAAWQGGGWLQTLAIFALSAFLLLIAVVDYEQQLIYDKVLAALAACGVAWLLLGGGPWQRLVFDHGLAVLLGGTLLLAVAVASRGGMGGGDIKFAAASGCWLTCQQLLLMLLLTFLAGGLVSAVLVLLGRKGRKDYIPFGPFLALGTWVAYVYGERLIDWYRQLLL